MRITDLLDKRSIAFDKNPANKQETLDMAVDLMCASGKINDTEAYRKQVYLREEESTTGIGEGIAIPHGKGDCVSKPGLAAMVIKNGVDFDSLDGDPVTLLFLIAAPNTEDNVHLEVLSKLSMMLMDEQFTEALRNATSAEEFLSIIDKADDERADIDEQLADTGNAESDFKILAVTACPTGIAHTYMAAEGIEKAAKAADCFVKIETRGSGGAKKTGRHRRPPVSFYSSSSSRQTAWAAMPSPLPVKPNRSSVVALTLTRSGGSFRASAMRRAMSGR